MPKQQDFLNLTLNQAYNCLTLSLTKTTPNDVTPQVPFAATMWPQVGKKSVFYFAITQRNRGILGYGGTFSLTYAEVNNIKNTSCTFVQC